MVNTAIIESATPPPLMALSVVDTLARALRTNGQFPTPLGDIRCEIVAMTLPVARTFTPPRVLQTFRNRSGYVIVDGNWYDTREAARKLPLAPGTYRIRISGDFYQDAEFLLQWPLPAGDRRLPVPAALPADVNSVQLLPSPAYPVPDVSGNRLQLGPTILRGSAYAADGAPLAGIRAEVIGLVLGAAASLPPLGSWPFLAANTDARGDWTLLLPDRRYYDATLEIPPGTPPAVVKRNVAVQIQYPAGAVVRTKLVTPGSEFVYRNTGLRGQILGHGGAPVTGATVTTSVDTRSAKSDRNGAWSIYFDLNQPAVPNITVTATTPDGATATANAVALMSEATIVVPTFNFP